MYSCALRQRFGIPCRHYFAVALHASTKVKELNILDWPLDVLLRWRADTSATRGEEVAKPQHRWRLNFVTLRMIEFYALSCRLRCYGKCYFSGGKCGRK
jgi:hypothetical protein